MNWDDARVFLAVAREGSFTGAARRLGVRHSTISRRVRELEKRLGTALVERSNSGFGLTADGEELHRAACVIEREMLAVEGALGGEGGEVSGDLHITAIANMASSVLMPIFAAFREAYPKINLRVQVTNNSLHLSERAADVALRQTNAPQETLIGTRLATVASAVYGSRAYLAALAAGGEERWIGVECCAYHRDWTREACPEGKDGGFCVDDTALTVAAIKADMGLAFLPCFIGDSDPALARLRPPEPRHDLGFWLLYHRDLRHNKRVILFRKHMKKQVRAITHLFAGQPA